MSLTIAVTGATGFVGQKLCLEIVRRGHHLRVISRNTKNAQKALPLPAEFFEWDGTSAINPQALEGASAVIHLAGENIASKRWSEKRKREILSSRIVSTSQLVAGLNRLSNPPKVLVGASAVGVYGDRGDEALDEKSTPGAGFLTDVCLSWEKSYQAYKHRLVLLRTGVVLGHGGAMDKMLPAFRLGVAGRLGSGKQWMSWVHIDDLVSMYLFAVENEALQGAFNAVAPNPVTNLTFTSVLARALHRPAFFPVPKLGLQLIFGEMSHVLLDSQKVLPKNLLEQNFKFLYPQLQQAVDSIVRPLGQAGAYVLEAAQWINRPRDEVFAFFSEAKNLEEITPKWLSFRIDKMSTPQIQEGTLIDYKLRIKGVPARWRTLISSWVPKKSFVDEQLKGPYKTWHHTHSFEDLQGGTLMTDRIIYRPPMGPIGDIARELMIKHDVQKIFQHRHKVVGEKFG